jgi:glycosyltransferase involved in cell wall biosynthesis
MRIAVWHNLPSGGGKRALYYHIRGLVERGHRVESWSPPTADLSYLPLGELVPEHTKPFEWTPFRGRYPLTRLITPYKNIVDKLAAMDRHCRACAEDINRRGFDVLFANACTFFRTSSIAHYVKIPTAIYLQEPFRWLYEALPELPWLALPTPEAGVWSVRHLKRFLANLVETQALRVQARHELANARAFDAILVNSLFSRESVLRAYGLDAKVCYLGVDTNLFVNERKLRREWFVVGLGAIVPEKRLELAIEAVALLPDPRPDLVWVGNVASREHLERMQRLARTRGVNFRTEVGIPDTDVVDLLNRAALLVYSPRLEPFGLAPLEANACGLPVVAVAEGGVRETILDGVNGLLVEDDPAAIAEGMQRVLTDPAYASRLGTTGCELVSQRWSLSAAIDRLEQRLAEVTRKGFTSSAPPLPLADTGDHDL